MIFRKARREDVLEVVKMLSQDKLGSKREVFQEPLSEQYYIAFEKIERDENQELIVVEGDDGAIIGTLQLSFIQYLTYRGGLRAQIEAVRVRSDQRGQGLGDTLFKWAIERSKQRGAHMVQLTTDKERLDAIRFYERLGFTGSHEGMKLHL